MEMIRFLNSSDLDIRQENWTRGKVGNGVASISCKRKKKQLLVSTNWAFLSLLKTVISDTKLLEVGFVKMKLNSEIF